MGAGLSPSNTGVPAGTALSHYTGPCTITANNTVIDSKTVNCGLTIRASGVQITNSKINGTVSIDDQNSSYSFTITDTEIDAGTVNASSQRRGHGDRQGPLRRPPGCTRTAGSAACGASTTAPCATPGSTARPATRAARPTNPASGWATAPTAVHNSLLCDAPDVPPDAGCSADLTGYGDFAPIRNNLIEKNLFLATTGGTCAYGGSSGDDGAKPYGNQAANIVFKDNVFQRVAASSPAASAATTSRSPTSTAVARATSGSTTAGATATASAGELTSARSVHSRAIPGLGRPLIGRPANGTESWIEDPRRRAAVVLGLPGLAGAAHLGLLALASLFYREPRARPAATIRFLVLVPAHNEEQVIGSGLEAIAADRRAARQVLVVADRCTDAPPRSRARSARRCSSAARTTSRAARPRGRPVSSTPARSSGTRC